MPEKNRKCRKNHVFQNLENQANVSLFSHNSAQNKTTKRTLAYGAFWQGMILARVDLVGMVGLASYARVSMLAR